MTVQERQHEAIRTAAMKLRECAASLDANDCVGLVLERMADRLQGIGPQTRRQELEPPPRR